MAGLEPSCRGPTEEAETTPGRRGSGGVRQQSAEPRGGESGHPGVPHHRHQAWHPAEGTSRGCSRDARCGHLASERARECQGRTPGDVRSNRGRGRGPEAGRRLDERGFCPRTLTSDPVGLGDRRQEAL